ncbi:MAG TPA: hypothetical protein DCY03_23665 [Planctomycetaceae bacterium]|nr:hypothetical protein [Planctomycetaceae bacterium]|tara:strand:+ start:12797 stop:13036 length:240 start_codon:yes stop_codon:yes gene_type:complete
MLLSDPDFRTACFNHLDSTRVTWGTSLGNILERKAIKLITSKKAKCGPKYHAKKHDDRKARGILFQKVFICKDLDIEWL